MKSIKNILGFGCSIMLAAVLMASCSSDDYTPSEQLKNAQVYFPKLGENVEYSAQDSTFDITVARVKADEALTVQITCDSTPKFYKVPTSVAFAKGQKEAKLTIEYEFDSIGYDNPSEFTLKIADGKLTTPYGESKVTFNALAPAPYTAWTSTLDDWVADGNDAADWPLSKKESTCTYTYKNFWGGDDPELSISYRQSTLDKTKGQFTISGCMYNIELVLNYNTQTHVITVDPQWTGYTHSSYGDVYITDAVNYWANIAKNKGDASATHTSTYNPTTGVFNIAMAYYVEAGVFGYDFEKVQVDGFYIPDYTTNPSFCGVLTDAESVAYAQINVNLGVDAKDVQALVVNKTDDAEAVADAILAGDVEGTKIEKSGVVNVPIGEYTGELQVVVASLADSAVQDVAAVTFSYYGGGKNPWESLGKGLYTDDAVSSLFVQTWSATDATYEVEILQNTETGNYRIMNPYSNSVYPFADNDCADEGKYLEINAEDPEAVYVELQELGFDWGYGAFALVSNGARYLANYDVATMKGAGYLGKVADNKIIFPAFARKDTDGNITGYYQSILYMGTSGYYSGANKAWAITLPAGVTATAKKYAQASTAKAKVLKAIAKNNHFGIKLPSGRLLVDKNLVKNVTPSTGFNK